MFIRIIFSLLFGLPLIISTGQQTGSFNTPSAKAKVDSTLYKKAFAAYNLGSQNADSAISLARQTMAEAEKQNDLPAKAMSLEAIGWAFQFKGHFDSCVIHLKDAYTIFKHIKSTLGMLNSTIELSEVNNKQSKFSDALKYVMEADSLSLQLKNERRQGDVKRMLAIIYRGMGDNEKATNYFKEAMAVFTKLNDKMKFLHTSSSLAILYRNTGKYDSSLLLAKENLSIAMENAFDPYQVGMYHEGVADSYLGLSQQKAGLQHYTDSALNHYRSAYTIFKEIKDSADIAWESYSIGKAFAQIKKYAEAEQYLKEAYQIASILGLTNNQQDISTEMYMMYENAGDDKKAFKYFKIAASLKDSVFAIEQRDKTNELKEKYETGKKEQEIKLLRAQNELAVASSRKTRLLQYIFILLFATSVIIGWLLYNRLKIKRSLKEQMLRNQIAGDLHDDIGSVLSSIDISSRIAMVKKNDAKVVEEQLAKIRLHARKTMESMSDIVWSINIDDDNFESVLSRMREFAAEICEPQQINLKFDTPVDLEKISLDSTKRKNLFLIFKEGVNNAVKYSQCNEVHIEFEKNNRILRMKITDNGTGFSETSVKKGNGIRNMKQRAANLKGNLFIESAAQQGTTIILDFPI